MKWSHLNQNIGCNEEAEYRDRKERDEDCQNLNWAFEVSIRWRSLGDMALCFVIVIAVIVVGEERGVLGSARHSKRIKGVDKSLDFK